MNKKGQLTILFLIMFLASIMVFSVFLKSTKKIYKDGKIIIERKKQKQNIIYENTKNILKENDNIINLGVDENKHKKD